MLPECLINIIDEYLAEIGQLESLPELLAIRKLAQTSDNFLVGLATGPLLIPTAVMVEIVYLQQFHEPYFIETVLNTVLLEKFNTCLICAMNTNLATSSLFWLFLNREPNLYFGPYSVIFESSVLFKMLNIVTSG